MHDKVSNKELAEALLRIADSLEMQNESYYRVRAYRKAAVSIQRFPTAIYDMLSQHADLTVIPHVGQKLAIVIEELITTKGLSWLPKAKPAEFFPGYFSRSRKPPILKISTLTPVIDNMIAAIEQHPHVEAAICTGDYRRKKELVSHESR